MQQKPLTPGSLTSGLLTPRLLTPHRFFMVAGALLLCAVAASVTQGSVSISWSEHVQFFAHFFRLDSWLQSVFDVAPANEQANLILSNLRWPRIVLALFVGACLASSGAALQGLFRNPLADPALIGISSGALLGASVVTVVLSVYAIKVGHFYQLLIIVGAFIGALAIAWLVFFLAKKLSSSAKQMILYMLLVGIAVSAFSAAGAGLSKYFLTPNELRQVTLWQLGSLQPLGTLLLTAVVIIVGLVVVGFSRLHHALNILALGAEQARYLGVNIKKLQYQVVILSAVGVGLCVAVAGLIGFVGLVAPHCVRLLIGPNHRWLIPGSALVGAIMLVFADFLSRQTLTAEIIPVGIVTAMIGAPWFLWVLLHSRSK